jgi:hypothetical protein
MPKPPHPFILEALDPLHPRVKPMFSGYAIYIGEKLVAFLRDKPKFPEDNGLWLVSSDEALPSLKEEFPILRSIALVGGKITHWQVLPQDSPDFEESALRACGLILRRDPRIGKIPVGKKPRAKKKTS